MEKIEFIPLDKLLLDSKNPRIYEKLSDNITQIKLAEYIYKEFGISDLKDSILKNGYFPVEPMVVIPHADKEGFYHVVEGNRRLTTIKILCDEKYREATISLHRRDDYIANEELKEKLAGIPVVVAAGRDSVNAYLGVRHLRGVIRWEPIAQAKYVYNQIIPQTTDSPSKSVKDAINKFVEETNNKKADVLNLFYKYCLYEYMQGLIEKDSSLDSIIDSKFSLLEVALGKSGTTSVAKYIGIPSYTRLDPEDYENIIPEDKKPELKNLVKWVFSENPPIKESREINKYLKPILKNPVSTKAFEDGEDKDAALLLSDSFDNIIKKSCTSIHKALTHIQQNWANTQPENRDDLENLYKANVIEKVKKTNKVLDVE